MPRSVAIILDPDYSDRLERLAFHTPVWLVDTPSNRTAAEAAWRAAVDWPHITVTLFRDPGPHARKQEWGVLLHEIAIREKSVDAVEVIGSPLTLTARAAFVEAGLARLEETAIGFRARRI